MHASETCCVHFSRKLRNLELSNFLNRILAAKKASCNSCENVVITFAVSILIKTESVNNFDLYKYCLCLLLCSCRFIENEVCYIST